MMNNDWINITLPEGFKGVAQYRVDSNQVTIAFNQVITPDLEANSATVLATLPQILKPSNSLEVREVTLMSNKESANFLISPEGNIILETTSKTNALVRFSVYKTYFID